MMANHASQATVMGLDHRRRCTADGQPGEGAVRRRENGAPGTTSRVIAKAIESGARRDQALKKAGRTAGSRQRSLGDDAEPLAASRERGKQRLRNQELV